MKDIVMTKWKKVDPGFLNSLRAAQDLISNAIHQNSDEDAVEHEGEGADDPEGDCTASHHAKLNQAALREIRDLEAKRALIEAMVDRITQQKAEMDKKNPASCTVDGEMDGGLRLPLPVVVFA
ncbi:unnamed protein product [Gongylonema pulchrum]|uniref:VHS domain-containing protein n=1 Tax=Gongylonema pulchrum TaxID=637853 RepID=A0A183EQE0_9BILA|nr:unnamed protein product [Gongylonema pulchrum]